MKRLNVIQIYRHRFQYQYRDEQLIAAGGIDKTSIDRPTRVF